MTLAEIFLLLLLVVWWASRLESDVEGADSPSVAIANLRSENAALKKNLAELQQRVEELMDDNKALMQMFGVDPEKWVRDRSGAAEDAKQAIRRGRPRCEADNVLAEVAVLDGRVTMQVFSGSSIAPYVPPDFRSSLTAGNLSGPAIEQTLAGVRAYYQDRLARNSDCRFDYRLVYLSDTDYRHGRERFEAFFYPAGLRRAAGPG